MYVNRLTNGQTPLRITG